MRPRPASRFPSAHTSRRLQNRFRPSVEALEDRTVPAYLELVSGLGAAHGEFDAYFPGSPVVGSYTDSCEHDLSIAAGEVGGGSFCDDIHYFGDVNTYFHGPALAFDLVLAPNVPRGRSPGFVSYQTIGVQAGALDPDFAPWLYASWPSPYAGQESVHSEAEASASATYRIVPQNGENFGDPVLLRTDLNGVTDPNSGLVYSISINGLAVGVADNLEDVGVGRTVHTGGGDKLAYIGDEITVHTAASGVLPDGARGGGGGTGAYIYLFLWLAPAPANSPPVLSGIGAESVAEGSTLTFNASATDPNPSQTLTFSLDSPPPGASIHPTTGTFTYAAVDGPGSFPVTVRVTDNGAGNLSDTETFTITVDNVPPRFDVVFLPPDEVEENDTVAISGFFNDPGTLDTHDVRVIWGDGHIDALNLPAGTFDFTAPRQFLQNSPGNAPYTFRVVVSDKDGDADASIPYEYVVKNVAPTASIAGPADGLKGNSLSFTLSAADVSPADQAAGFTYDIDWDGDGSIDESTAGPDGLVVDHTFTVAGQTTVMVTAIDVDGGASVPMSHVVNVIQPVSFDLGLQKVNLNGSGVLPIALLSTTDFDVRALDVGSLRLSGAAASQHAFQDVDLDGDLDLVLQFRRKDFVDEYAAALTEDLADGTLNNNHQLVELALTGKTTDGVDILASAAIDFFMSGKALQDLLDSL